MGNILNRGGDESEDYQHNLRSLSSLTPSNDALNELDNDAAEEDIFMPVHGDAFDVVYRRIEAAIIEEVDTHDKIKNEGPSPKAKKGKKHQRSLGTVVNEQLQGDQKVALPVHANWKGTKVLFVFSDFSVDDLFNVTCRIDPEELGAKPVLVYMPEADIQFKELKSRMLLAATCLGLDIMKDLVVLADNVVHTNDTKLLSNSMSKFVKLRHFEAKSTMADAAKQLLSRIKEVRKRIQPSKKIEVDFLCLGPPQGNLGKLMTELKADPLNWSESGAPPYDVCANVQFYTGLHAVKKEHFKPKDFDFFVSVTKDQNGDQAGSFTDISHHVFFGGSEDEKKISEKTSNLAIFCQGLPDLLKIHNPHLDYMWKKLTKIELKKKLRLQRLFEDPSSDASAEIKKRLEELSMTLRSHGFWRYCVELREYLEILKEEKFQEVLKRIEKKKFKGRQNKRNKARDQMNALVKFGFYEAPLQSCCDFLIKDLLKRDADLIEEPENPEGKEAYWFLVEDGEGERKSRVCCEPPEENSKSVIIFGKNKELKAKQYRPKGGVSVQNLPALQSRLTQTIVDCSKVIKSGRDRSQLRVSLKAPPSDGHDVFKYFEDAWSNEDEEEHAREILESMKDEERDERQTWRKLFDERQKKGGKSRGTYRFYPGQFVRIVKRKDGKKSRQWGNIGIVLNPNWNDNDSEDERAKEDLVVRIKVVKTLAMIRNESGEAKTEESKSAPPYIKSYIEQDLEGLLHDDTSSEKGSLYIHALLRSAALSSEDKQIFASKVLERLTKFNKSTVFDCIREIEGALKEGENAPFEIREDDQSTDPQAFIENLPIIIGDRQKVDYEAISVVDGVLVSITEDGAIQTVANNDHGWRNIKPEFKIDIKSKMKRSEQKGCKEISRRVRSIAYNRLHDQSACVWVLTHHEERKVDHEETEVEEVLSPFLVLKMAKTRVQSLIDSFDRISSKGKRVTRSEQKSGQGISEWFQTVTRRQEHIVKVVFNMIRSDLLEAMRRWKRVVLNLDTNPMTSEKQASRVERVREQAAWKQYRSRYDYIELCLDLNERWILDARKKRESHKVSWEQPNPALPIEVCEFSRDGEYIAFGGTDPEAPTTETESGGALIFQTMDLVVAGVRLIKNRQSEMSKPHELNKVDDLSPTQSTHEDTRAPAPRCCGRARVQQDPTRTLAERRRARGNNEDDLLNSQAKLSSRRLTEKMKKSVKTIATAVEAALVIENGAKSICFKYIHEPFASKVSSLSFSPKSDRICIGVDDRRSDDSRVVVYSVRNSPTGAVEPCFVDEAYKKIQHQHAPPKAVLNFKLRCLSKSIESVAFSQDGCRLAFAGGQIVRVVDAVRGDYIFECRLTAIVTRLAWSFDSTLLAVGSESNQATSASVTLWQGNPMVHHGASFMEPLFRKQLRKGYSCCGLGFEKDGRVVVGLKRDDKMRRKKSNIFAMEEPAYESDVINPLQCSGQTLYKKRRSGGSISCVAVSQCQKLFAFGWWAKYGEDFRKLEVVEVESGRILFSRVYVEDITGIAFPLLTNYGCGKVIVSLKSHTPSFVEDEERTPCKLDVIEFIAEKGDDGSYDESSCDMVPSTDNNELPIEVQGNVQTIACSWDLFAIATVKEDLQDDGSIDLVSSVYLVDLTEAEWFRPRAKMAAPNWPSQRETPSGVDLREKLHIFEQGLVIIEDHHKSDQEKPNLRELDLQQLTCHFNKEKPNLRELDLRRINDKEHKLAFARGCIVCVYDIKQNKDGITAKLTGTIDLRDHDYGTGRVHDDLQYTIWSIRISNDGNRLAFGAGNRTKVSVFDIASSSSPPPEKKLEMMFDVDVIGGQVWDLSFSKCSSFLAVGDEQFVTIVDESGERKFCARFESYVTCVQFISSKDEAVNDDKLSTLLVANRAGAISVLANILRDGPGLTYLEDETALSLAVKHNPFLPATTPIGSPSILDELIAKIDSMTGNQHQRMLERVRILVDSPLGPTAVERRHLLMASSHKDESLLGILLQAACADRAPIPVRSEASQLIPFLVNSKFYVALSELFSTKNGAGNLESTQVAFPVGINYLERMYDEMSYVQCDSSYDPYFTWSKITNFHRGNLAHSAVPKYRIPWFCCSDKIPISKMVLKCGFMFVIVASLALWFQLKPNLNRAIKTLLVGYTVGALLFSEDIAHEISLEQTKKVSAMRVKLPHLGSHINLSKLIRLDPFRTETGQAAKAVWGSPAMKAVVKAMWDHEWEIKEDTSLLARILHNWEYKPSFRKMHQNFLLLFAFQICLFAHFSYCVREHMGSAGDERTEVGLGIPEVAFCGESYMSINSGLLFIPVFIFAHHEVEQAMGENRRSGQTDGGACCSFWSKIWASILLGIAVIMCIMTDMAVIVLTILIAIVLRKLYEVHWRRFLFDRVSYNFFDLLVLILHIVLVIMFHSDKYFEKTSNDDSRWAWDRQYFLNFVALQWLFMLVKTLSYLRGFDAFNEMIITLRQTAIHVGPFMIVVVLVIVAFSLSFWVLSVHESDGEQLDAGDDREVNEEELDDTEEGFQRDMSYAVWQSMVIGIFGQFSFKPFSSRDYFSVVIFMVFMLLVEFLALNALIAIMGEKLSEITAKAQLEFTREKAKLIVEYMDCIDHNVSLYSKCNVSLLTGLSDMKKETKWTHKLVLFADEQDDEKLQDQKRATKNEGMEDLEMT